MPHMNDFQFQPGNNPSRPVAPIKLHFAVSEQGGIFECKCGKKFATKTSANRHYRTEAAGAITECPFGDYKTKRPDHLILHFRAKHCDQYHVKCTICGKWIFAFANLVLHDNHPRGYGLQCGICDQLFEDFVTYEVHAGESPTGCSSFKCKICHMTFQDPDAYEEHMRRKHPRPRHEY